MATINNLEISVHEIYAWRATLLEEYNRALSPEQSFKVPSETYAQQVSLRPGSLSEAEILFGIVAYHIPWALFYAPIKFIRRSPFAFYRVAPSLGTLDEQEAMEEKLNQYECHSAEEKQEKEVLQKCFKTINKLNRWLGEIVGRMGGLLPG